MQLKWREVRDSLEPVCLQETTNLSNLQDEYADIVDISPVNVSVCAELTERIMRVTGHVSANAEIRCTRCLTQFQGTLEAEIDERFLQGQLTPEQEEEEVHSVSGDTVLLDPYIYEAIVLAIPYRFLCDEQCLGLCPVCGTNRNQQTCSCDTRPIDPRLAGLQDFLSELDK